ncbi:hypothetical protein AGABI1DRAFT_128141 [Agaricus bisporus var. burnettii JB137-S8]|uniref:CcmS related domain-containing protein n=1 Tax=Agaricus bisporus var. burnettii (strain JB137-S8 / ATCC MYA-4627 / FGSC 10392) TaxID=597362 RepID=K5XB25_AGABU|nr:uncharacterized protein AGABI1DRAFT_128141 [Agaricus bisporus var. burnettii JB137-S8]EKM80468.1 hypothetical protein AGABI1DRAFT_128141 [Agaricus bisporus var. burnettii JB137-S8]
MAKKNRVRAREDDQPFKPAGNKPVKVVTFDTPKSESPGRPQFSKFHEISDNEPAASSPAAWGPSASDGWNNPSSFVLQPSSPPVSHTVPPPASQDVWAPPPTSPLPRASSTAPVCEKINQRSNKLMIEEPHNEHQDWNFPPHHADANQGQYGTPASNGGAPLPVPPTPQVFSPMGAAKSFGAMGATTKNPAQWTTASEQARQFARPPAMSRPPQQQAPKPSAPIPPPPIAAPSHPQMSAHQWATRSKAAPASPAVAERFGNRDDYAIVAAALNGEIKKAHYSRKGDHSGNGGLPAASGPGVAGWRNSDWSQQGRAGWGGHSKGNDAGGFTRSKGRNDGWGNTSDAGWSQSGRSGHHHPQKDLSHSSSAMHHGYSKSWQAWGKEGRVEAETESDFDDDDDDGDEGLYAEQPSNAVGGWGNQGDGGWGKPSGSGWGDQGGSEWNQNAGGMGSKGGGRKEKGGFNSSGGDGWTMNSRGDEWGGQGGGGKSSRKENGGWDTSGGDGWTTNPGGWDNDQGFGTNQKFPGQSKMTADHSGMAGTRNDLTPEQRSQILNNLLDDPHEQKAQKKPLYSHGVSLSDNPVPHKGHNQGQSWGQQDGWGPIHEEDEEDSEIDDAHPPSMARSNAHDLWNSQLDNTSYSMPSKTLTYAYKDLNTSLDPSKPRNSVSDHTAVQFVESHGTALKPVEQALFGRARWAQDRIHWMFSPYKDERVSTLLTWIESMSYHLGTFGLHKFLQSRERGAIITNAAFRLPEFPGQPVFDWLTFEQLQDTMDKTLQESVVFYDPGAQVIVYVLLPSQTGRSVAMWRRKINVPNNARVTYKAPITQALAGLKKKEDYVVYVDRIPMKPEDPDKPKAPDVQKAATGIIPKPPTKKLVKNPSVPAKKQKRKKWWQIFK